MEKAGATLEPNTEEFWLHFVAPCYLTCSTAAQAEVQLRSLFPNPSRAVRDKRPASGPVFKTYIQGLRAAALACVTIREHTAEVLTRRKAADKKQHTKEVAQKILKQLKGYDKAAAVTGRALFSSGTSQSKTATFRKRGGVAATDTKLVDDNGVGTPIVLSEHLRLLSLCLRHGCLGLLGLL